jgi:hypothetical protein
MRLPKLTPPTQLRLDQKSSTRWTSWADSSPVRVKLIFQALSFIFPDDVIGSDLTFAAAEARCGFDGPLFSLPTRWVNHPGRAAEFKPAPLRVTANCGLTTPQRTRDRWPAPCHSEWMSSPMGYRRNGSQFLDPTLEPGPTVLRHSRKLNYPVRVARP